MKSCEREGIEGPLEDAKLQRPCVTVTGEGPVCLQGRLLILAMERTQRGGFGK